MSRELEVCLAYQLDTVTYTIHNKGNL